MSAMFGNLLGGMGGAGGLGGLGGLGGAAGGPDMMSFFNNPSLMNMVRPGSHPPFHFASPFLLGDAIRSKSSSPRIVREILSVRVEGCSKYPSRMANLVTNLGQQEGGEVGLETLLQTCVPALRIITLIVRSFSEVNAWLPNYLQLILI